VPFEIPEAELRNRLRNKMIRPTTIPYTLEDLLIEQAVAREALRLAFEHHKSLARSLKGVQQQRTIAEVFEPARTSDTLVQMLALDMIIGSGGVLSHAPRREQAALMMLDAYQPEGVTELAVDSIFMMPHLGILSTVHAPAATQVFDRDCLIRLGTAIAPVGPAREGEPLAQVEIDGKTYPITGGRLERIPLAVGQTAEVRIVPTRGFDVGEGRGRPMTAVVRGGVAGLLLDGRGRPFQLPTAREARIAKLRQWLAALDLPLPA